MGWTIRELDGRYAVARLDRDAAEPGWIDGEVTSVTRTREELSIICRDDAVPDDVRAERGYVLFAVVGPVDFATVGLLASLTRVLAEGGVSIIAFSTYDTDYIGVPAASRSRAREAWLRVGFELE